MAPELVVDTWFNIEAPLRLASLRGKLVLIYAFQVRCLGCVEHSIPQAKRAHESFRAHGVQVLGLHTVFEDHASMSNEALRAFIAEHQLQFPIGVDSPSEGSRIPRTMRLYDMQGTPTLIAIDAQGQRRRQHFGHLEDAQLEALVNGLLAQEPVEV